MVGWWWVSSYVVPGTREEIANAQEKGSYSNAKGGSRRPTKKQKDRARQQRKSESERKEREREREKEEESAQWGPLGSGRDG